MQTSDRGAGHETQPAGSGSDGGKAPYRLSLDEEQKALAAALLRKSGIDFATLQRKELVDGLATVLVFWEHVAVFILAALPGVTLSLLSWWFFYASADSATRFVFFIVALLSGLALGAICGAIGVALRVLGAVDTLAAEGVRAMDEVRHEVRELRPSALKKLSVSDWTKGVSWIVVLPSMEFVLRRRLRIKPAGNLAAGVLRRAFRRVVSPQLESDDGDAGLSVRQKGNADDGDAGLSVRQKGNADGGDAGLSVRQKGNADDGDAGLSVRQKGNADEGSAADDAAWMERVRRLEPLTMSATRALRRWVIVPLVFAAALTLVMIVAGAWLFAQLLGL